MAASCLIRGGYNKFALHEGRAGILAELKRLEPAVARVGLSPMWITARRAASRSTTIATISGKSATCWAGRNGRSGHFLRSNTGGALVARSGCLRTSRRGERVICNALAPLTLRWRHSATSANHSMAAGARRDIRTRRNRIAPKYRARLEQDAVVLARAAYQAPPRGVISNVRQTRSRSMRAAADGVQVAVGLAVSAGQFPSADALACCR